MITKIRFVRDDQGNPVVELNYDTYVPDQVWKIGISEEAYAEWVPVSSASNPEGSLPEHLLGDK